MGMTPPPRFNNVKKTALFSRDGFPSLVFVFLLFWISQLSPGCVLIACLLHFCQTKALLSQKKIICGAYIIDKLHHVASMVGPIFLTNAENGDFGDIWDITYLWKISGIAN